MTSLDGCSRKKIRQPWRSFGSMYKVIQNDPFKGKHCSIQSAEYARAKNILNTFVHHVKIGSRNQHLKIDEKNHSLSLLSPHQVSTAQCSNSWLLSNRTKSRVHVKSCLCLCLNTSAGDRKGELGFLQKSTCSFMGPFSTKSKNSEKQKVDP